MDDFFDDNERNAAASKPSEPNVPIASFEWRRLLGFLRPYWWQMTLAILALLVSSGVGLSFPLVIVRLLDNVTQATDMGPLNMLAGLLMGLFLIQAISSFFQSYLLSYIGEHIVYDLRTSLYKHLQRLSLEFYSGRRVGEIISRLSSDVTQMRNVLTTSITTFLSQLVSLIGSIVIVLSLNTQLTLVLLVMVPVLVLIAFVIGRSIQKASTRVQDDLANSTVIAEEGLQGVRIVKSFGRESFETERYNQAMNQTFQASMRMAIYNSLFMALMLFLGFGTLGIVIWFGGREVIAGRLSLATISGFLIYGITIAASLGGLGGMYAQLRAALGGLQRVFELIDAEPTVQDAPNATTLPGSRGQITFDHVSFAYEEGAPVLNDVSLDIQAGEILALVGPSGAGKSTVLNIIPRFYDPTSGRVLLDGHDLRGITQDSLREQLAIVPQDTMLFGGTIFENIRYGQLDATDEEVFAAARMANAHDFIMGFPDKYQTVVGERGTKLSGGQRQRIAIARAVLKNPRILLLDEATSALDNESEALVQEALNRLMQGRTTIIIAHRLSTIKIADRIAVLDKGRVIELGAHDELMAQGGVYARLYAMQFRDRDIERLGLAIEQPIEPAGDATPSISLLDALVGRV